MNYLINGKTCQWNLVIGLEVHAQISSQSKLFSGSPTNANAKPNTQACFLDAGMPGQLPVINSFCIDQAIRTGIALNAKINAFSRFDRKNYFYPDLPQGYQISQYQHPIVGEGYIEVQANNPFTVRIERLHLEQDAGKSIHDLHPEYSHVDLNRSGVALMEIVSFPDMHSPEQAADYLRSLRSLLIALKVCHGNMEQGNIRADVNVSVRPVQQQQYGTRCEIKNLNSFRFIRDAIVYEAKRQVEILENGQRIQQETRLFEPASGITRPMRSKENAPDYRYFPDPDLPPLRLDPARIEKIRASMPELPEQKRRRFIQQYNLCEYDASVLTADTQRADFFEQVAKEGNNYALAANWVSQDLLAALKRNDTTIDQSPINPKQLGKLTRLINDGTISGAIAKKVFAIMLEQIDADPENIVKQQQLAQLTDASTIETLVDKIIAENPRQSEQLQQQINSGYNKPKALGWFVGQVMKASEGKANPAMVNKILKNRFGL